MKPNFSDKYYVSNNGEVFNTITGKQLSPWINADTGYKMISLSHDGIVKKYTIHHLVAMLYVPNSDPDMFIFVDHIDGNKLNNVYTNLEWVTPLENTLRAVDLGLISTVEDCSWAQFTNDQIHQICKYLEQGLSNIEIITAMGFPNDSKHKSLIGRIRTGKQWKQISSQYSFDKKPSLRKYSDDEIHLVCKCLNMNLTPKQIATKFGITDDKDWQRFRKMVRNVRLKQCYTNISDKYF